MVAPSAPRGAAAAARRWCSAVGRAPPLAVVLLAALLACTAAAAQQAPAGFVTRKGAGFVQDGAAFHVVGTNQCARAQIRMPACVSAPPMRPRAALQTSPRLAGCRQFLR
jgi:hypothetical protein